MRAGKTAKNAAVHRISIDKSVQAKFYNCSSTTSFRAPPIAPSTSCSRTNNWSGSGSGSGNNCTCNGFPPAKSEKSTNRLISSFSGSYLRRLANPAPDRLDRRPDSSHFSIWRIENRRVDFSPPPFPRTCAKTAVERNCKILRLDCRAVF